ncbi:hypothetical protein CKO28_06045 [Rhodovibrio sodomensis]|uniref:Uncharacterized protein n=2 Tax=Rhodovibrio sodomensis TaxID=1088 RepID=A0ABS1DDC1_9PROT|nr:hypothetical protein [Rhodovibrio sodomensis]
MSNWRKKLDDLAGGSLDFFNLAVALILFGLGSLAVAGMLAVVAREQGLPGYVGLLVVIAGWVVFVLYRRNAKDG